MGYILTVTLNAAIDTTLLLPTAFRLGQTNRPSAVLKLPGGKGVNVARVLHNLGLPAMVTGFVGGSAAAWITAGLAEAGIDAAFQPITGSTRTCTAIVEGETGRVTEVNEPGPTILAEEARAFLHLYQTLLPAASVVVLSGSLPVGLPPDYYSHLVQQAASAGIPAILDTSGPALDAGLASRPLLVKPNVLEAQELLGQEIKQIEDAVWSGHQLRKRGAHLVALTRGAEGAVLVKASGAWAAHLAVARPLSTVGCGDAFLAGFLAGLQQAVDHQERPSLSQAATVHGIIEQALRLAMACSAANTLHLGAGILTVEEVDHFRPRVAVTVLA